MNTMHIPDEKVILQKMDIFERMIPLTPLEASHTEDVLVDAFIAVAPEIESSIIIAQKDAKGLSDIRERIIKRNGCIGNVSTVINRHWAGREPHEVDMLAEYCVVRYWILNDEERKIRDELKREKNMATKRSGFINGK